MISGSVKSMTIDANGNLSVETEYTLTDNSKVTGRTRYTAINFSKDRVLQDVKAHCETLMLKTYNLKQNVVLSSTKVDDIKYDCTSAVVTTKPEIKDEKGNVIQAKETITIDDK